MDPLEGVFVFCFVFGAAVSLISFAMGAIGGGHGGLGGHGDAHGLHGGHAGGHGAIGAGSHSVEGIGDGHAVSNGGHGDTAAHDGHAGEPSPFNLTTITAFMAFFGGTGWVLYSSMGLGAAIALILATLVGVAGGAAVFWFLVKVLLAGQTFMDPSESKIEGTIARVTVPMQERGVGEIVFSREGARRSEGARSATGVPIARGTEVVIVRYEGGLAYVEPWTTYAGEI